MTSKGYIRIPKSLLEDPLWENLSPHCQMLFIKIVELALWEKPQKHDDFGKIIEIQLGQICITQRDLMAKMGAYFSKNDIHRNLLKLQSIGFLNQEVNHRKNILTITHKDTYDLIIKRDEPENEPNLNQTRTKLPGDENLLPLGSPPPLGSPSPYTPPPPISSPTPNPSSKKGKKERHSFVRNAVAFELAKNFFQSIKNWKHDFKSPNVEKWAEGFDKIIELDKRDVAIVNKIIEWLPTNEFWRKNILCPEKLRKQFDRLEIEIKSNQVQDWSRKNINTFVAYKKQYPEEFKHMQLKGLYIINTENAKEISTEMNVDVFEKHFLHISEVQYA